MMPLAPHEARTLLRLARISIEDRVRGDGSLDRALASLETAPALLEVRASFVTLHTREAGGERLRGCIGSLEAVDPLVHNVTNNARQAAFHDPRFPPLTEAELARLVVSISVLTPLSPVPGPASIVPGRDGVLLERGSHRSVFLPEVATDQGWSVEELLENLALKAGLKRPDWRGATLSTFETEVIGEE
jgi:AmmeMemoRadiSam system protein A